MTYRAGWNGTMRVVTLNVRGRTQIRAVGRTLDRPEDGLWAGDHYGVVADLDLSVD